MSIFYEDDRKRIHKIVASPYANNCYIIVCKTTNSSAIIDAPIEYEKIIRECEGTDVEHILITHNHFDHLEGFKELRNNSLSISKINKKINHLAASYILQGFLDSANFNK